ncbi:alkylhydroperoxidase/carboxymuconolactone decarboxylase family protein [Vibrio metschnikovii]|uniref:carboxymuconolactone decarboxylase family protein n=1 Tax=Vibrio metschnikovii TaxID=28172 RepID=UPI0001B95764|nr:carboxymuconolactone decarboxylase family protein [Vibrio metschnikovii]EEX37680.1 alkylhydroperoxidase like protein AhpD family [Vibrio metschnikovii CIP 69.14]SUP08356.1 alkylhydroperoxidase/carboxymuconolactone decarboxylase family protein [Vibrio metschnikovii]SUP51433.1 alkylhydroperoxidase/carboxymuconolactone decarboxylase family protein [Vibrio metschnikovii]
MKSYSQLLKDNNTLGKSYKQQSPDTLSAFMQLHKAAMAPGELDLKTKEMIALGIAIAARCDGCIAAHVFAALKAGSTQAELVEVIDVAVLMGGGPSLTYGIQALGAIEEFAAESQ